MRAITTKADCLRKLRAGALGNTLRTWDDAGTALRECLAGEFALRSHSRDSRHFTPLVSRGQLVPAKADLELRTGERFYICERAGEGRTLQGQFHDLDGQGLQLEYTTAPGTLPEAFAIESKVASRSAALHLLRTYMDGPSFDDAMALRELYPGHVVEFTCFDSGRGVLGRNCIFWEVRGY